MKKTKEREIAKRLKNAMAFKFKAIRKSSMRDMSQSSLSAKSDLKKKGTKRASVRMGGPKSVTMRDALVKK